MKEKRTRIWIPKERKSDLYELKSVFPERNIEDITGDAISEFHKKVCNSKKVRKNDIWPKW